DLCTVDVAWKLGFADDGTGTHGLQVVSIERDVERTPRRGVPFPFTDQLGQPVRQLDATPLDPNQHEPVGPIVELHDLARHALEGAVDRSGVEESYGILSHAGGKYSRPHGFGPLKSSRLAAARRPGGSSDRPAFDSGAGMPGI